MNNYLASFGPALANHLWQSTAFVAAAWLLTILLRRNSARVRYGVWLAASVKFLIPFSLLIALGGLLPKPTQPVAPAVYTAMQVTEQPFADFSLSAANSSVQTLTLTQRLASDLPAILLALWLAGVVTVLIIWFVRWRRASVCLLDSVPAVKGRELDILRSLEARVGGRSHPPLRIMFSPEPVEPSIYGVLLPVLVWPERLSERLSSEQIEAIMAHELAHARRFDNATAALQMLVEAIFWFHPLVWWMERRMIEERERACDEAVAALGGSPEAYAEGILETCRFCVAPAVLCVSGITGADLRNRVLSIMKAPVRMRMTWSKKLLVSAAALCAVATPVLLGQLRDSAALLADMPAAQQSQQSGSLRFEVAAIKPGRAPEPGMNFRSSRVGTTLRLENMPLRQLVEIAFSVSDYALKAPAWLDGQTFDIEAKIPEGGPFSQKDVNEMWLNLLIDRFGMKWHEEQGVVSGYELVSGRKLLLKPSDPTDPKSGARSRGPALIAGHDMPMSDLATGLGEVLGAPVVDNTRISGGFDVNLIWRPDDDQLAAVMAKRMNVSVDDLPSTVFLALQEQAGLKLQRAEVPSRIVVVDSMNRQPTDGFQSPPQPAPTVDWEKAAGGKMSFEVASVKEDSGPKTQISNGALRPPVRPSSNFSLNNSDAYSPNGGLFSATNWPLAIYIGFAYKLDPGQIMSLVSQLPKWANEERFDIQARAAAGNASKDQMRLMMQSLLANRFQLAMNVQREQGPVYALVLNSPGKIRAQLIQRSQAARCDSAAPVVVPSSVPQPLADDIKDLSVPCGTNEGLFPQNMPGMFCWVGRDDTLDRISGLFSSPLTHLNRPVLDRTGLTGRFDFILYWAQEPPTPLPPESEANPPAGPTFVGALKDQLGLKLEPTTGSVEKIVVDHVEEPTPN